MAWQSGAPKGRRGSSPKGDDHWQGSSSSSTGGARRPRRSDSPKHALDHLEAEVNAHAAEQQGVNTKEFNDKMAKAEKALLYRLRFEGEYMRKKKRDYDKFAKQEAKEQEMEEAKAAAEERIKQERTRAQEELQQRKLMRENAKVERSLSTGLAAFRKVKKAQRDAKRYAERHVLLSEQFSHLNFLVERKKDRIKQLEATARARFLREQEGIRPGHGNGGNGQSSAASVDKNKARIALRSATQGGDSVPFMTIAQRTRQVEKYQHVVEHRLRNTGDLNIEVAREREEIDRLRRSYRTKQKDLDVATSLRDATKWSLNDTHDKYDAQLEAVRVIEKDIALLEKSISEDQHQFSEEWDSQMDQLTSFHREATRKVDEMGGQSRKRAKSMFSRKISHLSSDRHSRLLGLDNSKALSRNHQMVMKKERKQIKTMDEAFQAITRATGIESLEELVDTFVHADRRNYSVVKHITALERDVDELTAETRNLKERSKRLEFEQQRSGMSRRQKVTAMARELDTLKRQNEVLVSAHERNMRVISEIGPEVHDLFVQLGCQDTHVPDVYTKNFMTDRNLMRMLGLVDQQTALVMSVFGQLAGESDENGGGALSNIKGSFDAAKSSSITFAKRTLSSKPAPPKIGDFDEDDGAMEDLNDDLDSLSSGSSSSSDSDDSDDRENARRRKAAATRAKQKKKSMTMRGKNGGGTRRSSGGHHQGKGQGGKSAIQKPESISHLRKHIQRKVESGNHHHHHGSVMRFKPTSANHFNKRDTFIVAPSGGALGAGTGGGGGGGGLGGSGGGGVGGGLPTGLGISADQLAALQSQHGGGR